MTKWQWILLQFTRKLWVKASLIGSLGLAAALLASLADNFTDWQPPLDMTAAAVNNLLSIMASSMLAVTTFSLSVMTSAYGAATSNVTPRATRLLMEDGTTQGVLSVFVGSFIFSMVGMIVLQADAYAVRGRFVLFLVTVIVIAMVVTALLRWIDHLTRLGRVSETSERVEQATQNALELRLKTPYLGGHPRLESKDCPSGAIEVNCDVTGYIQHIDMQALSECADLCDGEIYLEVLPGNFVHEGALLVWVRLNEKTDESDLVECIRNAFSIEKERNFDQDPRFGLAVLSEIGVRALSPGINDPGTAIDILTRNTRLLVLWSAGRQEIDADEVLFPRLHVYPLSTRDLFDDAFRMIARDGAGSLEVQLRLQKSLCVLNELGDKAFQTAAREMSDLAWQYAKHNMYLEDDLTRLSDACLTKRS